MKKILILITVAAITLAGCMFCVANTRNWSKNTLKGSGNLITKTFDVDPFDKIHAHSAIKINIVPGSGAITVKADDNAMEYIKVEVKDGTLDIRFDDTFSSFNNVTFEATVPSDGKISKLVASGASKVVSEPVLTAQDILLKSSGASKLVAVVKCENCKIEVSGASKGEIGGDMNNCEVEASGASKLVLVAKTGTCDIRVSGASKMEVTGSAQKCTLKTSGASSLDATNFITAECDAWTSGASKVSVNCTGTLRADTSSASKLVYTGGSKENTFNTNGASSVTHK